MGTTTFYLRLNDLRRRLSDMTKEELTIIDNLSPYKKENHAFGWHAPFELHNGNVYVLVFWKGKLMKIEEAPAYLNKKYYNKYTGKTLKQYEWALLKKLILSEIECLDKNFKKGLRKKKQH